MAQIKQLKDTTGNFYPVTHKDAIVGIEDIQVDMTGYATEQWVTDKGYLTDIPNYYITETELDAKGYLSEHQDISGKVDIADFEEATLVTSAALNALNQNLAAKESDIQLLQAQVLELQNQISTLIGHYNELENITE